MFVYGAIKSSLLDVRPEVVSEVSERECEITEESDSSNEILTPMAEGRRPHVDIKTSADGFGNQGCVFLCPSASDSDSCNETLNLLYTIAHLLLSV